MAVVRGWLVDNPTPSPTFEEKLTSYWIPRGKKLRQTVKNSLVPSRTKNVPSKQHKDHHEFRKDLQLDSNCQLKWLPQVIVL